MGLLLSMGENCRECECLATLVGTGRSGLNNDCPVSRDVRTAISLRRRERDAL